MKLIEQIKIAYKNPTPNEYYAIRNTTGWNKFGFKTRPTSRPGMYMINKKVE